MNPVYCSNCRYFGDKHFCECPANTKNPRQDWYSAQGKGAEPGDCRELNSNNNCSHWASRLHNGLLLEKQ